MSIKKFNPFLVYSEQLQELLSKAAEQKNPAEWLYKNNARSVLFMLEALTRLHNKAFDEKLFAKWNKRFKKLEDVFGQIDDYAVFEKEFHTSKKIPAEVTKYFTVNKLKYIEKCNQRLREKDWLADKMTSFDNALSEFDVEYNQEYIDELKFAMADEIDAILYFVLKYDYHFTKVEEQVHELRRKLRWLSIYGQALHGLIQLKKSTVKSKTAINYFTKDIVKSPYNKLPARPKNTAIIEFDHDSFFALSWLIAELGTLKDKGLKIIQLGDAIFIAENVTQEQARQKAITMLGYKGDAENALLKDASDIVKTALAKDKIIDKLLIG
ncbi:MAG: hypothetical protein HY062_07265 [Bacteroidetes bacterium]|nr:hypothetical protein [Bacteroidota bacterium]